ncbi:MAG TPA: SRPBCC family protein [Solirubrobacteraceae bacterium]|nr:SRPBCC family protein [Solirubrobacteraceae bacterium]
MNVEHEIRAVGREVGPGTVPAGEPGRVVTLTRAYATTPDDLFDACTNAERIPRWFLPVTGELREGGRYQLEGNAGGTVERCDPPRSFAATWEFGGALSWIEVSFTALDDGRTELKLVHTMGLDDGGHWARFGPGAVGVGWELGLLGLSLFIDSGGVEKPALSEEDLATSPEGRALIAGSATSWGEAAIAGGEEPEQARTAAARTAAFYTGAEVPA